MWKKMKRRCAVTDGIQCTQHKIEDANRITQLITELLNNKGK